MTGLNWTSYRIAQNLLQQKYGTIPTLTHKDVLIFLEEFLSNGESYAPSRSMYSMNKKQGASESNRVFRKFVEYCLYRNIANYDSMILISSDKGCLTDDSLIEMPRDLKKYPKGIPMKELLDSKNFYVYSYNVENNKLEIKQAKSCEFAKIADVYEIETKNGYKLKCTEDHPFLLIDGSYKQLKDLDIKKDRLRIFIRPETLDKKQLLKVDYSRPGSKSYEEEYRFIAKETLGDVYKKIVHHLDGNHFNNNINNLEILSYKEHNIKHENIASNFYKKGNLYGGMSLGIPRNKRIYVGTDEFSEKVSNDRISYWKGLKKDIMKYKEYIDKLKKHACSKSNLVKNGGIIKSIKYIGKKATYDIVGVKDNKNFIANGFMVSNTGKSSFAMMLAHEWCKLLGIKFDPNRHFAYTNQQVMDKIRNLNPFEPLVADEAINFATSENWAKAENKELKKVLGQVRTKHLFYILCFPLKIMKLDKIYLESYVNYWIDLFARGTGALYVKDKNPYYDAWRMKEFQKLGHYNEFSQSATVHNILSKHPNFWYVIRAPKPPETLYNKYLKVREFNVYDDQNVLLSTTKEDLVRAVLLITLKEILQRDSSLSIKRLLLHLENVYQMKIEKPLFEYIMKDAAMLADKIKEENLGRLIK